MRREKVAVLTQGTLTDTEMLAAQPEASYLLALAELAVPGELPCRPYRCVLPACLRACVALPCCLTAPPHPTPATCLPPAHPPACLPSACLLLALQSR